MKWEGNFSLCLHQHKSALLMSRVLKASSRSKGSDPAMDCRGVLGFVGMFLNVCFIVLQQNILEKAMTEKNNFNNGGKKYEFESTKRQPALGLSRQSEYSDLSFTHTTGIKGELLR